MYASKRCILVNLVISLVLYAGRFFPIIDYGQQLLPSTDF